MILPAKREYITREDWTKIEKGHKLSIDSGMGGGFTVIVLKKTAESIMVQPVKSWFWEGSTRPKYTYTLNEALKRLYTLAPANPWDYDLWKGSKDEIKQKPWLA